MEITDEPATLFDVVLVLTVIAEALPLVVLLFFPSSLFPSGLTQRITTLLCHTTECQVYP